MASALRLHRGGQKVRRELRPPARARRRARDARGCPRFRDRRRRASRRRRGHGGNRQEPAPPSGPGRSRPRRAPCPRRAWGRVRVRVRVRDRPPALRGALATARRRLARRLLAGPAALADQLFDPAALGSGPASDSTFAVQHGLYWLAANAAYDRPTLIAVDDLHWSDGAPAALAHLLAPPRRPPAARRRSDPPADQGHDPALVELLGDSGATTLEPRPLGSPRSSALRAESFGARSRRVVLCGRRRDGSRLASAGDRGAEGVGAARERPRGSVARARAISVQSPWLAGLARADRARARRVLGRRRAAAAAELDRPQSRPATGALVRDVSPRAARVLHPVADGDPRRIGPGPDCPRRAARSPASAPASGRHAPRPGRASSRPCRDRLSAGQRRRAQRERAEVSPTGPRGRRPTAIGSSPLRARPRGTQELRGPLSCSRGRRRGTRPDARRRSSTPALSCEPSADAVRLLRGSRGSTMPTGLRGRSGPAIASACDFDTARSPRSSCRISRPLHGGGGRPSSRSARRRQAARGRRARGRAREACTRVRGSRGTVGVTTRSTLTQAGETVAHAAYAGAIEAPGAPHRRSLHAVGRARRTSAISSYATASCSTPRRTCARARAHSQRRQRLVALPLVRRHPRRAPARARGDGERPS
jgi:hypothetical protein